MAARADRTARSGRRAGPCHARLDGALPRHVSRFAVRLSGRSDRRNRGAADGGHATPLKWSPAAIAAARELSGYVLTQSPERAIALADRFDGPLLEVSADVGDVADRADEHMTRLRRTVRRAVRSAMLPRCRQAAVSYFRQSHRLTGRAREVTRTRGGYKVGEVKRPFDRALWERGLTPRGREAVAELASLGNPEPTPADVMSFLLRNRVEA